MITHTKTAWIYRYAALDKNNWWSLPCWCIRRPLTFIYSIKRVLVNHERLKPVSRDFFSLTGKKKSAATNVCSSLRKHLHQQNLRDIGFWCKVSASNHKYQVFSSLTFGSLRTETHYSTRENLHNIWNEVKYCTLWCS